MTAPDLADFLLARIAEDEAIAVDASHLDATRPGEWETEHHNSEYHAEPGRAHIAEDRHGHYWTVADEVFIPIAEHIARHDPARVLTECDAKRRIVNAYLNAVQVYAMHDSRRFPDGSPTSRLQVAAEETNVLLPTLACLALPFADHPDYRPEWAPT